MNPVLSEAVTEAVVSVRTCPVNGGQAIGGIIGIGVRAIIEQVTVVIPGVGPAVYTGKAIGDVVRVCVIAKVGLLRETIANRVIHRCMIELAIGVICRSETIAGLSQSMV